MADVFLSYKREDRASVEKLAHSLETSGHSVWWDGQLEPGQSWDREIERQIELAAAVVVIWSKRSVHSENVRCEADFAREAGTLVPVSIERCELPLFQRTTQVTDISDCIGDGENDTWRSFLSNISEKVRQRERRATGLHDPRAELPKWGFGIAPPKPHLWKQFNAAAEEFQSFLSNGESESLGTTADAISEMKGLFNRCCKKDQWNWFVIWQRLGFPSLPYLRSLVNCCGELRRALIKGDSEAIERSRDKCAKHFMLEIIDLFLGDREIITDPGNGFAFIMASRSGSAISATGATSEPIIEFTDKLNEALSPDPLLGIFHAWRVNDTELAGRLINNFLKEHKVRSLLDGFNTSIKVVEVKQSDLVEKLELIFTSNGLLIPHPVAEIVAAGH